jgi:Fic family protein
MQETHKTFRPLMLSEPLQLNNERMQELLANTMRYLGELNAYAQLAPDADCFIKMHIAREAVASCKIAGIHTNFLDVLQDDEELHAELAIEKRDDLAEVQNYIKAINAANAELKNSPLINPLLCRAHQILLSGVRGYTKSPGKIRKILNGATRGGFVPPSAKDLPALFKDLEDYWHADSHTPPLIKIALTHYQFEIIQPFLDGNGRLGRLLITLQLIDAGILSKPAFYISDYFESHKAAHYDALERVRNHGEYEQWIQFFLEATLQTARDAKETLQNIVVLRESYLMRINNSPLSNTRQKNALELLKLLFARPVVSIKQVSKDLGRSIQTTSDLIDELESLGMLREMTGDAKNRKYVLGEYFDLFN